MEILACDRNARVGRYGVIKSNLARSSLTADIGISNFVGDKKCTVAVTHWRD